MSQKSDVGLRRAFPFGSCHAFGLGGAERLEAGHEEQVNAIGSGEPATRRGSGLQLSGGPDLVRRCVPQTLSGTSSLPPSGFGRDIRTSISRRRNRPRRRPRRCVALRISLRAVAAGQSSRHRRPFLRRGMIAVPPCRRIALWHYLASKAPSPVTVPICSAAGIWSSRWGRKGLRPCRPCRPR